MRKIFLQPENISDKSAIVGVHFMPFDEVNGLGKTEAELNNIGKIIEVSEESIENDTFYEEYFGAPQIVDNTYMVVYLEPTTKKLSYEYKPIPERLKTTEELLQEQIQDLTIALAELMGVE